MSKNKSSLKERILKNSTISETSLLNESKFFGPKNFITTSVPAINIALSGDVDGGLLPGVTMIAGPSRNFKTGFMLLMAKAFLDKYSDGVILFYDSEFGSPQSYFEAHGIPLNSVIHTPITDVEAMKHDIMNQLKELDSDDNIMICVDSIGNMASKKEIGDALDGEVKADFTRAKALKSLFRMITPHLTMKAIPFVCVNHTYKEMSAYPRDIVGGGCLLAGTLVRMDNGSLKPIEEFQVGDMVQTEIGPRPVTHTWNPETLVEGTPECFEVVFEDETTVVCSAEHKFIVNGQWKKAKNLSPNDDVSLTGTLNKSVINILLGNDVPV